MNVLRRVGDYELIQDRLQGVSRWGRVSDDSLTLLQTGQDSEEEVARAMALSDADFVELGAAQEYHG